MQLHAGVKLGPYEVISLLGSGGMGEVYTARDPRLQREVAIKVLPPQFAGNSERMRRFEQEARAAGMLNHPNILTIYDIGSTNDHVYVVSELLTGKTLRDKLKDGPLPTRKVVDYALQIARGLSAAHDKGIVHRDLKPENIFITQDGRAKILDFGLAKLTAPEPVSARQSVLQTVDPGTEPGVVLGTMGYMPPEQVRGRNVDHRSDIFSFGAILYEMLSGKRAFQGDTGADVITAILKSDPREVSSGGAQMPPGLQRVIQHCLEKDPEERFQSVRDLAFDLEMISGISGASSGASVPAAAADTAHKKAAIWKLLLVVGLLIVFGIGLGAGKFLFHGKSVPSTLPLQVTFEKLTDIPGEEYEPNLAPDGKTFAYVRVENGNSDIYVSRIGGRNATNLTHNSANDLQPAFSPSGDLIAFRSGRDGGGIFVMGASGESVRRLTDFGYFPSWSPDGKEIFFSTGLNDPLHAGGNTEIWAVNVHTGQKRKLLEGRDFNAPQLEPGGSRIAYWGLKTDTGQRDIWLGDPGTKNIIPITDDSFLDWGPVWSPDRKYLYFISDRSGSMNLARVELDLKSGKPLKEPENIITPSAWIESISFSSNPKQLVYAAFDRRSEILKFDFDPVQEKITSGPQDVSSSTDFYDVADVSPDGQWLTFFAVWPQQDIYVIRTDGTEKAKLTNDAFRDRYPSWSPDGKSIAFISDRSGKYEHWIIHKDGSNLQQMTNGQLLTWDQHYSANGQKLLVVNDSGTFIYDVTGSFPLSNPQKLPALGTDTGNPFNARLWSPDGKKMVGDRYAKNNEAILYFVDSRSYKTIPIPPELARADWFIAGWFPDSVRVLITSGNAIYTLNTESGELRKVSELDSEIYSATFTSGGRAVYIQRTVSQSDIWMATLQ